LVIDESFADAHVAMATELSFHEWDWKRADHHFKRAFELKLSNALGYTWAGFHLAAGSQHDAAIAMAQRAVELDPFSPIVHTAAAADHGAVGRMDDAMGLLLKALELDPNMPVAHFWLGWCYVSRGRYEEAIESLQKAEDSGLVMASGVMSIARSAVREQVLEIQHRLDDLSSQRYVPFIVMALVRVGLGDKDGYLDLAKKARAAGEPFYALITTANAHEGVIPSSWVEEMPPAWGM
jgi:tetratricopeptide (TPR) repeat protein